MKLEKHDSDGGPAFHGGSKQPFYSAAQVGGEQRRTLKTK